MILSSETSQSDATQMLEFYKNHFAIVDLVTCGKCSSFLAFECSGGTDGMGLQPNELGKYIIPIGENLLSHRVRLDEAPTGERMVGYQCGAPTPNPLYPAAKKQYDEDLAAYEKKYAADVAASEKNHNKIVAQLKKEGKEVPELVPQAYLPPVMPNVPEIVPCGNDTRIAEVERGLVPVGGMQTALSPFEKHQIREQIKADKKHKPDFKKIGHIKHYETFRVERIS